MTELGDVTEPFEAGVASRCSGEPGFNTADWPKTCCKVVGLMRTASGLVMASSGISAALNKS